MNAFSVRWVWGCVLPMCVVALACDWLPGGKQTPRPDVVVVAVDSLRRDHLDLYDYARPTGPNLRTFATDAVVFQAAHSPSSWAKPAVASLLTGLYPWSHAADGETRLAAAPLRLPELLAAANYATFAASTHAATSAEQGFAQGFDEFVHMSDERADAVIDAALRRIEQTPPNTPLLLFLHLGDPRGPYDAPPPHGETASAQRAQPLDPWRIDSETDGIAIADLIEAYDAEIAFVDAQFGRLLTALRSAQRYDAAMIVFTGTHGEELQDHGRGGHGRSLHEEVVAVPLLMKFPRQAGAGAIVHAPVSLIDIVPTLLPIAGVITTAILEGTDLSQSAHDQGQKIAGRAIYFSLDRSDEAGQRLQLTAISQRGYKMIATGTPPATMQLFHLAVDPFEQNDLAEDNKPHTVRMMHRLTRVIDNAMLRRRDLERGERLGDARGVEPYIPSEPSVLP